jgi:hypothetical protein
VKNQIFNIVSMLDMAGERETEVDRFSTLPDDILTHIMKFMVTKEAVQTGILSKRWKHVWTTLASLIVNSNQFQQAEFFKMFLSRLLQQNDLLVALKKIEVKHNGLIRSRLLEEIINSAISHQMEELVLHVFLHNDVRNLVIFQPIFFNPTIWFICFLFLFNSFIYYWFTCF